MTENPDARRANDETGAVSGHDRDGWSEPQNPVGATGEAGWDEQTAAEVPAEVPEEVVADALYDDSGGDDETAYVALDAPGETGDPPFEAPAAEPTVGELRAEVAELGRSLAAAQRRADELATVARMQTAMADELHADNRRLRDGEIREAVAPLVRGLARLADDLGRMHTTTDAASTDLEYLGERVAELLHDAGVITVRAERGEPFDPQSHQAAGSATTDDSALHRTVAEVRRTGLRRDDGRMLRPVEVVVYRYVAPPAPERQPATEEVT